MWKSTTENQKIMGKIHKLLDKDGSTGLYPVTVGDAVVVDNKKLSTKVTEIDSSISDIKTDYLDGYKLSVGSEAGSSAKTIYFVK